MRCEFDLADSIRTYRACVSSLINPLLYQIQLKGSSSWGDYNGFDQDMMSYQPYGWGYDDDANSLLSTSEYSGG